MRGVTGRNRALSFILIVVGLALIYRAIERQKTTPDKQQYLDRLDRLFSGA